MPMRCASGLAPAILNSTAPGHMMYHCFTGCADRLEDVEGLAYHFSRSEERIAFASLQACGPRRAHAGARHAPGAQLR